MIDILLHIVQTLKRHVEQLAKRFVKLIKNGDVPFRFLHDGFHFSEPKTIAKLLNVHFANVGKV